MLWHQRSEHIFIKRIKQLINDEVLSTLYFADQLNPEWELVPCCDNHYFLFFDKTLI